MTELTQNLRPAEVTPETLVARLRPMHDALTAHSVYELLHSEKSLKTFMEHHVFAVWDFMCLLKTLQQRLTCVSVPWVPSQNSHSARLINEIVLAEETDGVEGGYYSHFELYLRAMEEVGASTDAIQAFTTLLREGMRWQEALRQCAPPEAVTPFLMTTMDLCSRDTHEVAASFLFGRESVLPDIFRKILTRLETAYGKRFPFFTTYLARHIDVDENHHAPQAMKLLKQLCGDDRISWIQAANAAQRSLRARMVLWDTIQRRCLV